MHYTQVNFWNGTVPLEVGHVVKQGPLTATVTHIHNVPGGLIVIGTVKAFGSGEAIEIKIDQPSPHPLANPEAMNSLGEGDDFMQLLWEYDQL